MHSLSCENEFYMQENEKSFPYQRLKINLVLIPRSGVVWNDLLFTCHLKNERKLDRVNFHEDF